jgi:hypothetical protein
MSLASEELSGVNVPAIVMINEIKRKIAMVKILLVFEGKLFQKFSANHVTS